MLSFFRVWVCAFLILGILECKSSRHKEETPPNPESQNLDSSQKQADAIQEASLDYSTSPECTNTEDVPVPCEISSVLADPQNKDALENIVENTNPSDVQDIANSLEEQESAPLANDSSQKPEVKPLVQTSSDTSTDTTLETSSNPNSGRQSLYLGISWLLLGTVAVAGGLTGSVVMVKNAIKNRQATPRHDFLDENLKEMNQNTRDILKKTDFAEVLKSISNNNYKFTTNSALGDTYEKASNSFDKLDILDGINIYLTDGILSGKYDAKLYDELKMKWILKLEDEFKKFPWDDPDMELGVKGNFARRITNLIERDLTFLDYLTTKYPQLNQTRGNASEYINPKSLIQNNQKSCQKILKKISDKNPAYRSPYLENVQKLALNSQDPTIDKAQLTTATKTQKTLDDHNLTINKGSLKSKLVTGGKVTALLITFGISAGAFYQGAKDISSYKGMQLAGGSALRAYMMRMSRIAEQIRTHRAR